jgi:hypothetical protein
VSGALPQQISANAEIPAPPSTPEARATDAQSPATRRLRKFLELSLADRALLLKLWILLPMVAALVRLLDYPRTLRLLSRWLPAVPRKNEIPEDAMAYALRLGRLAKIAGRYVPTNGSCLRQSLAVWWLLRRMGVPAELRIGVSKHEGFAAHAWVELAGKPVTDGMDVTKRFAAFDVVPARDKTQRSRLSSSHGQSCGEAPQR